MVVSPLGVRIRPSAPPRSPSPPPPPQRRGPKPMPRNDSLDMKGGVPNGDHVHAADPPSLPISALLPSLYPRPNCGDHLKEESFDFENLGDELFGESEIGSQESGTTRSSLSYHTAPQGSSQSTMGSRISTETARFADISDLEPNTDAENNNRIAGRQSILNLIPSAPPLTPNVTIRPPRPQHQPLPRGRMPTAMPRSDSLATALIPKDIPAAATVTNVGMAKLSGDLMTGWGRRVAVNANIDSNGNGMNSNENGNTNGNENTTDPNAGYSEIRKKPKQSAKKASSPLKKVPSPSKVKIPKPLPRKLATEKTPSPPPRGPSKVLPNSAAELRKAATPPPPSPIPPTPPPRLLGFVNPNDFLTEDESVIDPNEKPTKISDVVAEAVEAMAALDLDPGPRNGDVGEPPADVVSNAESAEPEPEEQDPRFVEYRRRNSILPVAELRRRLRQLNVAVGPMGAQNQLLYAGRLARAELEAEREAAEMEECRRLNYKFSPALERYIAAVERCEQPDVGKAEELLIREMFNAEASSADVGCFCYLLIDPRELLPVPNFRDFVNNIFYIGKGKRSRPLQHLCDAIKWKNAEPPKRGNAEPTAKIGRIIELWNAGTGVVSLHLFNNINSDEALIREAVLIEAMGVDSLTNQKRGDLRGSTRQWPRQRLAEYGAFLLRNAHQVYLNERCRPIFERDVATLKLW